MPPRTIHHGDTEAQRNLVLWLVVGTGRSGSTHGKVASQDGSDVLAALGILRLRREPLRFPATALRMTNEELFGCDVDDLDVGILMVPLCRDAIEGEAEGF